MPDGSYREVSDTEYYSVIPPWHDISIRPAYNYDLSTGRLMPLNKYTPVSLRPKLGEFYLIYGTLRRGHRNAHLLLPNKLEVIFSRVSINNYRLLEVCQGVPAAVPYKDSYMYADIYDMAKENIEIMQTIEKGYDKIKITLPFNSSYIDCSMWVWPDDYNKNQLLDYRDWDRDVEKASYDYGLSKRYRNNS